MNRCLSLFAAAALTLSFGCATNSADTVPGRRAEADGAIPAARSYKPRSAAPRAFAPPRKALAREALSEVGTGNFRAPAGHQMAFTAYLRINVRDVRAAVRQARELALKFGGYVKRMDDYSAVLAIPVEKADDALAALARGGVVSSLRIEGEDVTEQSINLKVRLDNLEKSRQIFGVDWKVPYLHIDPATVGRKYEKLIRINSQSGKGGVAYVLEHDYGIYPPKGMHPEIGAAIQAYADRKGDELNGAELLKIFNNTFVNIKGPFALRKFTRIANSDHDETQADSIIDVSLQLSFDGKPMEIRGSGNGPISATVHAVRNEAGLYQFVLEDFSERTLGTNADANAIAFVGIRRKSDKRLFYGVGEHANIDQAAIAALFSALNRAILEERGLL